MARQDEAYIRAGVMLLLIALLAAGFWLRVRHLEDLGLVVDAGSQALAVRGILQHGVPKVDSGLIYARAIPFLYAQAASAALFGLNDFSLRLPSVLFGVAAIFAAYVLAKSVFNRQVGFLTAAIMTFSVWEIEMSRFARFYTAFQCMYLISLLCFYRGFMLGERLYQFWFAVAAFITFSTHELAVFLTTCFLIPMPSPSYSPGRKLIFGLWAIGLGGVWMLYRQLIKLFAAMGEPLLFPASGELDTSTFAKINSMMAEQLGIIASLDVPDLSFVNRLAGEDLLALLGLALVPSAATVYLIYRFSWKDGGWHTLFAVPIVWMAFIHQFVLVLVLLAAYLVLFAWNRRSLLDPTLKVVSVVALVCLAFWICVLAAAPEMTMKLAIKAILGYPNVYSHFLKWIIMGWPVLTVVFALGSILLLGRFISDRSGPTPLFMLGAIFIPAVLAGFFRPLYIDSRYIFHLYPLLVIIFATTAVEVGSCFVGSFLVRQQWSQSLAAIAIALAALFISQDANPVDAWSVGSRTSRSARDWIKSPIAWELYGTFHQDHKSPSLYVRERLVPGDRVVVLGLPHMITIYLYYIGQVDYAVGRPEDFLYRAVKGGKAVDCMTGAEALESLPQVKDMIEDGSGGGIWLLGDRITLATDNPSYSQSMKEYLRSVMRNADYLGLDGQTFAVKVR